MNIQNRAQKKIHGVTRELYMRTISKKIKYCLFFVSFTMTSLPPAIAEEPLLQSKNGDNISINIRKERITAKDKEKNIDYEVTSDLSRNLQDAIDIQLISKNSTSEAQLYLVLVRKYSKPLALGQGYCGAGYEDYIFLLETLQKKLILHDKFLLQSCLKNVSMFIDSGDEHPSNGLKQEANGSLSYRLIDDSYNKKRLLLIRNKRLKIMMVPLEK